jgi:hypothetical protein
MLFIKPVSTGHLLVWITQGWLNQERDTLGSFRLDGLSYLSVGECDEN